MERVFSENVGAIPHFYGVSVTAHVAALTGPVRTANPDGGGGMLKVHEWEWRSYGSP
jgi:hypothetical protein